MSIGFLSFITTVHLFDSFLKSTHVQQFHFVLLILYHSPFRIVVIHYQSGFLQLHLHHELCKFHWSCIWWIFSNHVDGLGPGCALWHDRVAAGVVTWSWSPRCSFGLKIFKCLNCCRHHVDSLLLPLSDGRLVYSVARWPWCGTNKDACKRLSLWLGSLRFMSRSLPQAAHPCPRRTVAKKAWEKGEELRQAVKAMDDQHLVEIARQCGGNLPAPEAAGLRPGFGMQPVPDDQAGPRPGLPLRRWSKGALLRLLGTKQNCQTLRSAAFRKQAAHANSTGRNRTKDFVTPDSSSAKGRPQEEKASGSNGPQMRFSERLLPKRIWWHDMSPNKWMEAAPVMPPIASFLPLNWSCGDKGMACPNSSRRRWKMLGCLILRWPTWSLMRRSLK